MDFNHSFDQQEGVIFLAQQAMNCALSSGVPFAVRDHLPNTSEIAIISDQFQSDICSTISNSLVGSSLTLCFSSSQETIFIQAIQFDHSFGRFRTFHLATGSKYTTDAELWAIIRSCFDKFSIDWNQVGLVISSLDRDVKSLMLRDVEVIRCPVSSASSFFKNLLTIIQQQPAFVDVRQQLNLAATAYKESLGDSPPIANDFDSLLKVLREVSDQKDVFKRLHQSLDIDLLGKLLTLFGDVQDLTNRMCDLNSFNLVLLRVTQLAKRLSSTEFEDSRLKLVKTTMSEQMPKYFEISNLHRFATILTPRFRSAKNVLSADEYKGVLAALRSASNCDSPDHPAADPAVSPAVDQAVASTVDPGEGEFDDFAEFAEVAAAPQSSDELEKYLNSLTFTAEHSANPLRFWSSQSAAIEYPKLSQFASKIFTLPAHAPVIDLRDASKKSPQQIFINLNKQIIKRTD